jgi:hypothetical protein
MPGLWLVGEELGIENKPARTLPQKTPNLKPPLQDCLRYAALDVLRRASPEG